MRPFADDAEEFGVPLEAKAPDGTFWAKDPRSEGIVVIRDGVVIQYASGRRSPAGSFAARAEAQNVEQAHD